MSEPVYVVADLTAVPDNVEALRQALKELVVAVRSEPGCLRYDLHESPQNPGHFAFYEIWSDGAALAAHNDTKTMEAFADRAGGWIAAITVNTFRKVI